MPTTLNEFDTTWAPPNRAVDGNGATHDSVQSAVDNANGLVLIGPGTFEENVTVDMDDLTLLGVGDATTIDGGDSTALTVESDGVTVKDIAVTAKSAEPTNSDALSVRGGADNARLRGVAVKDADRHGIHIGISDNARIVDCDIESADENGLQMDAGASAPHVSSVTIESGVGGDGINCAGSIALINGAQIDSPGGDGIDCSGDDAVIGDVTIRDAGDVGARFSGEDQTLGNARLSNSATSNLDSTAATSFTQHGVTTGIQNFVVAMQESSAAVEGGNPITYDYIDNFEDENLDEYSGDVGSFNIGSTSASVDGEHVLVGGGTNGAYHTLTSDTGLDNYPERGDEIVFYVQTRDVDATKSRGGIEFAQKDAGGHYWVSVDFDADRIEVGESDGSSPVTTAQDAFANSPVDDTWYRVSVDFGHTQDDTISATVTNTETGAVEATASITSTTYDFGDFAWSVENDGSTTWYDKGHLQRKSIRSRGLEETTSVTDDHGGDYPHPIDSFEDGSASEYEFGDFDDTETFEVQEQPFAVDGENVLAMSTGSSDDFDTQRSETGLENYPERGDTFAFYARVGDSDAWLVGCAFAAKSINDRYSVDIDLSNDRLDLYRIDSFGDVPKADEVGFANPPQIDTWYRVNVDFGHTQDDTISATVTNTETGAVEATASITDTTHDHGAFAWESGGTGMAYVDHAYLKEKSTRSRSLTERVSPSDAIAGVGPTVVDSFEDEDYGEYTDRDIGEWGFTSLGTISGSAATVENPDSIGDPLQTSTFGLNAYPRQGDEISVWQKIGDVTKDIRTEVRFAVDASDDYIYLIRLDPEFDTLFLAAQEDGPSVAQAEDFFDGWESDTWYETVIEWDDGNTFGRDAGDMRLTLYDEDGTQLAQTQWMNDTELDGTGSGRGIAIGGKPNDGSGTTTLYFDEYTIKNR